MNKGTILITGAGGFTGIHACRHFVRQGYSVIGAVRSRETLVEVPRVNYLICDMTDERAVLELVSRTHPDYVLHLAGKNSVPESWAQPFLYMKTNLLPVLTLLESLRSRKTKVLIVHSRLGSALSPKPAPDHPYGLSKSLGAAAALGWAKLFDQPVILAEPGNLIGPGPSTGFCSLLARHIAALEQQQAVQPFVLSSGLERRDFLDVRDAVKAYEHLLLHGEQGTVYPVCSGQEYTLQHVIEEYQKLTPISLNIGGNDGQMPACSPTVSSTQPSALFGMGWSPAISWNQSLLDALDYFRGGSRLAFNE